MGRIITNERKEQIKKACVEHPDALGPKLGQLIIDGNVPVDSVAAVLSVSEPTIYRWMYMFSTPRDPDKIIKVERLLTVLRKAKRAKDLPLEGSPKERFDGLLTLIRKHKPHKQTTA